MLNITKDKNKYVSCCLKTPKICIERDYHDFRNTEDIVKHFIQGFKYREIGYDPDTNLFAGIAYCGRKPSKKWIRETLKKYHIKLENTE